MGNIGSITPVDVAEGTAVLNVTCSRRDRAGRYQVDSLIAHRGADLGTPLLLRDLSANRLKRQSINVYDLSAIHCPDLPALFLPPAGPEKTEP
jgi:hypothetical protein